MKFETLKKNNTKGVLIGTIGVIAVLLVGVFASSFAKYKLTQSIPLANGTINYKVYDFKIKGIYQENTSGEYEEIEKMPSSGYIINESKSYCYKDNEDEPDNNVLLKTIKGNHTFSGITPNNKCYLYFDRIIDNEAPIISKIEATEKTETSIAVSVTASDNEGVTKYYYSINNGTYTEKTTDTHTFSGLSKGTSYTISVKAKDAAGNESAVKTEIMSTLGDAKDTILAGITPNPGSTSFTGVETGNAGIFTGTDNDGTTYYWRGAVTNNYLKFANKWWRIIRINGDGTIRIIYDGTAYHANGSSTANSQIKISCFNQNYDNNAYVGFMFGATGASTYAETHTNTNKSTILSTLETWYNNNLASYTDKIDINAGFCGDRSINTGSTSWVSWDTKKGFGINATAYGPFSRIFNSGGSYNSTQTPTFNCPNSNDLYTMKEATKGNKALDKPIGLITADEVIYAGGFGNSTNYNYYLYNGSISYWTMSPSYYNGMASELYVGVSGSLNYNGLYNTFGIRPVINLRADVPITGSGTGTDPFVVS